MPNPIFFVDGETEQRVVQEFCKGAPVQRTALNGRSVTIAAIAKRLAALITLRGGRNYPIVILIDREQRQESCAEIAANLRAELEALGFENEDLRIGVADRMFENWILADWESITTLPLPSRTTEGRNGVTELKRIVRSYHKSRDGVKLFKAANQELVYANSRSYRFFADQLTDLNCFLLSFLQPD